MPVGQRGFTKGDPNINRKGRVFGSTNKPMSRRELKEKELISLLRKIKPHAALAINQAVNILGNKEAAHTSQLKAAVIILDAYQRLVKDVYDGDEDAEGVEVQPSAPVFSLRMINNEPAEDIE